MGLWDTLTDMASSVGDALESFDKVLYGDPKESLQKRVDNSDATSKFIGSFRWEGGPETLRGFTVIYHTPGAEGLNRVAVLKSPDGELYMFTEHVVRHRPDLYGPYEYKVEGRSIVEATPREIIENIQSRPDVFERQLKALHAELEPIYERFLSRERARAADQAENERKQAEAAERYRAESRRRAEERHHEEEQRERQREERSNSSKDGSDRESNGGGGGSRRQNRQEHHKGSGGSRRPASSSGMTVDVAREVLDVSPTASVDDIKRAYRVLASKLHPDRPGGSPHLMKQLNEAKEILLPD